MLGCMEIGVLGATGPAGRGLAARLADAGFDVIAGSRDEAKASAVVDELWERWGSRVAKLRPGTNAAAAGARDVVVVATTWEAAIETASTHANLLAGKVVVAMANGLRRVGREFQPVLPAEGSVAAAMQARVPEARVVAAFQHIPAEALMKLDTPIESDVIVCGDDDAARRTVMSLVTAIPNLRTFDGGSLANAVGIEAFAALLLSVNLRHKGRGTLRLLGVEEGDR
jgi:8-hydroxy-5-deazaflavin:NADPH oxidoreductase